MTANHQGPPTERLTNKAFFRTTPAVPPAVDAPFAPQLPGGGVPGQPPQPRPSQRGPATIDWHLVRGFRTTITAAMAEATLHTEQDRKQFARNKIAEELRIHVAAALRNQIGAEPVSDEGQWTDATERAYAEAVFNSIFGFGRLQPLMDDPDVENIEIYGCDDVKVVYGDGRILSAGPIATTDEELIEDIRTIADRGEGGQRAFTRVHPEVDVSLDNRYRLHATGFGLTPRPVVTIRQHGYIDVDLDQLVKLDMLEPGLAQFLTAAVRAHRSIVVAGSQGAGKTTFLRALANAIPVDERIGTIESEYELLLHTLPHRHSRIIPMQSRRGGGQKEADGTNAGDYTIDQLLTGSLRQNLSRIIVGEVRGAELWTMFQAMTASSGSLSTIHAKGSREAIHRMITLAALNGGNTELAARTVAENIDLIVYVDKIDNSWKNEPIVRHVSSVLELSQGENNQVATTELFRPDANTGQARFVSHPRFLPDLERAGYNPTQWGWTL
jgi:pilus assembly protein CpaF